MYEFESQLKQKGFALICGVDEAGCGPLAGPVYAAAVILPEEDRIEGLNDSKKLSEGKRELLFDEIIKRAKAYAVASADEREIDELNILQARLLAMRRAVKALGMTPDALLIDGDKLPNTGLYEQCIVKGDSKSASIAAASILAKVSRDRYMLEMATRYPQYQFEKHKGYPTKLHMSLIVQHGLCEIHRKSFTSHILGRARQ